MAATLREVGYRLTPQRMMILAAIYENEGHITAEAIHERVTQQYPFVDISTVYRTLQLLKKLRLVTETDLGEGVVEYELRERGRHHHLVCRLLLVNKRKLPADASPRTRDPHGLYGGV